MPKLVVFRGDDVESETRLAGRPIRLGRDGRNDIVLDDRSVSRFHAEVRPDGVKYIIVDLKSRNGIWVNGQQARGKTTLALGTPVTLGAFELTLEDDVPTGEFAEESPLPLPVPGAAVNVPSPVDPPDQGSRSATRASMKTTAPTARRRQAVSWAAAAVLIVSAATFALIRYRTERPAEVVEIAVPPAEPPPLAPPVPVDPPAVDTTKAAIEQHLADAKTALAKGDYADVREHVNRVLELDPGNQEAADLKRQADASTRKTPQIAVVTPPPPPVEVETPNVPRRTGEAWLDYLARVQRIDANLKGGRSFLDKLDFANALARFRLIDRDQRGYPGIDALIADTVAKQRAAFDLAMDSGLKNEQANRLRDARLWYQRALLVDPNAAIAHENDVLLMNRMLPEATRLFNTASYQAKAVGVDSAVRTYQQVLDMMLPGDEIRELAAKELEKLKR